VIKHPEPDHPLGCRQVTNMSYFKKMPKQTGLECTHTHKKAHVISQKVVRGQYNSLQR